MAKIYRLTTIDNDFNPFTQYREWLVEDIRRGYNTNEYIGRIAKVSEELSSQEYNEEIKRAIDEIIKFDFMNIYKVVSIETEDEE